MMAILEKGIQAAMMLTLLSETDVRAGLKASDVRSGEYISREISRER